MLLVMAASEQASAAAAAALQAAAVSFFTAPGSTATPCSRNMDAAVVFVPTKSTAIASRRLAWGSNYDGCAAAVRTLPKRSQRLQPELREERYGMSQHLHRSEANLGCFCGVLLRQNPRATLRYASAREQLYGAAAPQHR